MTCNTSSSNISGTPIAGTITQVGSRLEVGPIFQSAHGFTAGNVIRFHVATNGYTLAQADSPANAEVCGVVSDIANVNVFTYTVEGDVTTTQFAANNTIFGSTGAEVFFLSAITAGVVDSVPPNNAGNVLKSIMVRTPSVQNASGVTQEHAIVKNYVGNYLGGDTAVYMSGVNPVGSIHAFVGDTSLIPAGWTLCDGGPVDATQYPNFATSINNRYGFRQLLTLQSNIPDGEVFSQGSIDGRIIEKDNSNNRILVERTNLHTSVPVSDVLGSNQITASKGKTNLNIQTFTTGDATVGTTPVDVSSVSLDSVLTPDFRNKFIMGAPADDSTYSGLNETGGYDKIDFNQVANLSGTIQNGFYTTLGSVSNMPPYVSVNWIIRIGDSSYTSFLNQLSLKTLSLTDLPTSDPSVAGALWSDSGTLKISSG